MGFFHKFLSLGSKRSNKRRAARHAEARAVPPPSKEELRRQQEEQEEVASRLLRSSSLRYAVVNEVDYAALPPLRMYSQFQRYTGSSRLMDLYIQRIPSIA